MQEAAISNLFSARIRNLFSRGSLDMGKLQEVRMRAGNPLLLRYCGNEFTLTENGELETDMSRGCVIAKEELNETLEYISGYSLYAFDEEMKQGFITVAGGHRVGVAGKIVMEDGKIQCIRHISCINIRLSHQILGCADLVLPYLVNKKELCHTLIISPPRCGKTTLLRDIIRQVSNGNEFLSGRNVGVVDERSELAGCYQGIPQNDLGIRTDVLDCCSKSEGMMMLLRSMSPQVIAVDEIGSSEDGYALENVFHCGCRLIATVHGTSVEDIRRKPLLQRLVQEHMFERYVVLCGREAGMIKEIFDDRGSLLYRFQAAKAV